jgi:hypothetical protein
MAGVSRDFTQVITRYLGRKLELTPNRPWPERARITCGLSLSLADTAARAHQRFFIVKPRKTKFRRSATPSDGTGCFCTMSGFQQSPVLHEFGHTMGI